MIRLGSADNQGDLLMTSKKYIRKKLIIYEDKETRPLGKREKVRVERRITFGKPILETYR